MSQEDITSSRRYVERLNGLENWLAASNIVVKVKQGDVKDVGIYEDYSYMLAMRDVLKMKIFYIESKSSNS